MDSNSLESYHASRDIDLTKPHKVLDFTTRQIVVPLDGLFKIIRDMDHASRDMDLIKPQQVLDFTTRQIVVPLDGLF